MAVQKKAHTAKTVIAREASLADFEEQALDALGSIPGITLILNDGEKVTIPHPMVVDDDRQADIERVQSGRDLDPELDDDGKPKRDEDGNIVRADTIDGEPARSHAVRLARAILGPNDHAKLLAGGGKSAHVALAWTQLTKDMADDPKASA